MSENNDPRPRIDLGPHKHYKGGLYDVEGLAFDKTHERWVVTYHALGNQALRYTRDFEEFTGMVEVDGQLVPRYRKTDAL